MKAPSTQSDQPSKKGVVVFSDAIKEAERILDILSEAKNASTALAEFKRKHVAKLPKSGVMDLELIITSLGFVYKEGRRQVAKVSVAGYVLPAYDKFKVQERKKATPSQSRSSEATIKLKAFVKKCKNPDQMKAAVEKVKEKIDSPIRGR